MKILFLVLDKEVQDTKSHYALATSTTNSTIEIVNYLQEDEHEVNIVQVNAKTNVHKAVMDFNPSLCIIEGIWMHDASLKELASLPANKNVKWVVRIHDDIGYLAGNPDAMKYITEYSNVPQCFIATNDEAFNDVLKDKVMLRLVYLPNLVTVHYNRRFKNCIGDTLDVGCFGKMHILKNQCYQALVAMEAADKLKMRLRFHVTQPTDVDGEPIIKNLKVLFGRKNQHELIVHPFMNHKELLDYIKNNIDVGMQLSYTDTFNMITADFINSGVPVIVSKSIGWAPDCITASTVDYHHAVDTLIKAYKKRDSWWNYRKNFKALSKLQKHSWDHWATFLLRMKVFESMKNIKKIKMLEAGQK